MAGLKSRPFKTPALRIYMGCSAFESAFANTIAGYIAGERASEAFIGSTARTPAEVHGAGDVASAFARCTDCGCVVDVVCGAMLRDDVAVECAGGDVSGSVDALCDGPAAGCST